jgi:hypothetical protein
LVGITAQPADHLFAVELVARAGRAAADLLAIQIFDRFDARPDAENPWFLISEGSNVTQGLPLQIGSGQRVCILLGKEQTATDQGRENLGLIDDNDLLLLNALFLKPAKMVGEFIEYRVSPVGVVGTVDNAGGFNRRGRRRRKWPWREPG